MIPVGASFSSPLFPPRNPVVVSFSSPANFIPQLIFQTVLKHYSLLLISRCSLFWSFNYPIQQREQP